MPLATGKNISGIPGFRPVRFNCIPVFIFRYPPFGIANNNVHSIYFWYEAYWNRAACSSSSVILSFILPHIRCIRRSLFVQMF